MWQDASKGDGGADQGVEFLVSADGELEVARGNALDFEILRGVLSTRISIYHVIKGRRVTHSSQLKNFGGEVFKDGSDVHSSLGSDAHLVLSVVLQETLDTTAGELERGG